jgi:hypothetical protein
VQAWRLTHPGYSKAPLQDTPPPAISAPQQIEVTSLQEPLQERMAAPAGTAIQISCNAPAPAEISAEAPLQDIWTSQPLVLIGLIAHIWDSPLQDVIAPAMARLYQLGLDIQGGQHVPR